MAKAKLSKAQVKALDRDSNGEAGGSLSKAERERLNAEQSKLRRDAFGF